MLKQTIYLVLISILVNVVGCTTYSDARNKMVENLPESERAYLVGKYSVECSPNAANTSCPQSFNSISVHYMSNGELKYEDRFDSINGSMLGNDTSYDIIDYEVKEKSYYFCRILPEGMYSLFTIRYWNFAGGGSGYYLGEEDQFEIPFRLEAGKISLIDHLKLTTNKGKNLFGITLPAPGGLEIRRIADDEIQLAIEKCPEVVRGSEVIPQDLWEKYYDSPFVRTEK